MRKQLFRFEEVTSPPVRASARAEIAELLLAIQEGLFIPMPSSRPMPNIGRGCHELRVGDENVTWRIVYHVGKEHIVLLHYFKKKTGKTPTGVIDLCKARLKKYKAAMK